MKRNDKEGANRLDAERIDDWLRRGLSAESETAERLVRRAQRAERPAHRRRPGIVAATVAVAIVLAVAAFLLYPRFRELGPGSPAAPREVRVTTLTITNESGRVELLYPSPTSPSDGISDRTLPPRRTHDIAIFNRGGIIAAIVPAPITHHFILGGEP